jgi:membrane associated rhomboid family serine protease
MAYQQYRPNSFKVLPAVVKNLLILNALFFLATYAVEKQYQIDLTNYLGLHYFSSELFRPYQIITYMFMHGGLEHIFFNMFALWMFGNVLENYWGPKRFLIFYMITGIGAALIYLGYQAFQYHQINEAIQMLMNNQSPEEYISIFKKHFSSIYELPQVQSQIIDFAKDWTKHPNDVTYLNRAVADVNQLLTLQENIPMVGASGAVFGILVGFGMLFPNTELYLMFIPIPIKAKYAVILYGGIELFLGVAQFSGDNIAHFAHIGGAIVGFIMVKYWQKNNKKVF